MSAVLLRVLIEHNGGSGGGPAGVRGFGFSWWQASASARQAIKPAKAPEEPEGPEQRDESAGKDRNSRFMRVLGRSGFARACDLARAWWIRRGALAQRGRR